MLNYKNDYVVVIPARAGSRRISDKNNQKIGSKTLVEWAIECALTVFSKDKIVLVTDSVASAETGKNLGIEVIDRPPEVSGAYSSTESVISHVHQHYPCENYVLLQPTSPFRTKTDIEVCLEKFEDSDVMSVMSATIPWNSIKDPGIGLLSTNGDRLIEFQFHWGGIGLIGTQSLAAHYLASH